MMPTFTRRASTVIPELELYAKVFPAEKRHRCLEVVALRDLFLRLIHGVVDLLEVDAGGDIERSLLCHGRNVIARRRESTKPRVGSSKKPIGKRTVTAMSGCERIY